MTDRKFAHFKDMVPGVRTTNQNGECGVEISLRQPESIVQVGAWPDSLDSLTAKLKNCVGSMPESKPGSCAFSAETIVICLTPGQFLVLSDDSEMESKLRKSISADEASIVNLSQARAGFRISGSKVKQLLRKGLAIDLDGSVFPVSSAAQTTIDHVSALVIRVREDEFDIFVPSSFGQSFAHWLTDSALEFGYSIGA